MLSVPCSRSNCLNKGLLLIDADSMVFLLNGTVTYVVKNCPEVRTQDERASTVIEELMEHLRTLTRCTLDGHLYTSERILYEELDIVRPCPSVEKWLRGSALGRLHRRHMRPIQQVLHQHLSPILADDDVKNALRQKCGERIWPTDRDATLLAAACEKADSGERTLILAHNHGYEAPIRRLRLNEVLVLGSGRELSTRSLERRPYERFLLTLHGSCCVDSARFKALARAFYKPQMRRLGKTKKQRIKDLITASVLPFVEDVLTSVEEKASSTCIPAWEM